MKTWRLTSEVIAFVSSSTNKKKVVYLASPEKKKYTTLVSKIIPDINSVKKLNLEDNLFELKFNSSLQFFIKSSGLPTTDWYMVGNPILPEEIGLVLLEIPSNNGEFGEVKFEPVFLEDSPEISFITDGMSNYNTCFNEMKRRINCEICPKTRKRVPGHRYDTLNGSYIYLGKMYSRKSDEDLSDYLTDITQMPEVNVYVKYLLPGEKSIEDVLNNRIIGLHEDNIIIERTTSLCVDSGKVLEGNITFDQTVFGNMFQRAVEIELSKDIKTIRWRSISEVLENVSLLSTNPTDLKSTNVSEFKDLMNNLLEFYLNKILLYHWTFPEKRSKRLCSANTKEENEKNLTDLFFSDIADSNALKDTYYSNMFKDFGVDFKALVENVLSNWKGDNLLSNFDDFIKYREIKAIPNKQVMLRTNKSLNYSSDKITLSQVFGEGKLKDTVIDIIKQANDTFGMGVEEYKIINSGTKRCPKVYTRIIIKPENIIDFLKDTITDDIKNEIVNNKISQVFIEFDEDSIIE